LKKRGMIHFVLCISLLFLSGCWDRKELNDRAIWLATGWDVAEDGGVEISGQIVIPANISTQSGSGGATGKGFFTTSAKGKDVVDALENLQTKLPRESYFGHRRVIFLGEEFAKRGLKNELDTYQRNPDISLRSDIFIVKGDTAKELLTIPNPMEKSSSVTALKEHKENGGRGDTAYLNFLLAATREGIRPSIPVIKISHTIEGESDGKGSSANKKIVQLAGVSVFDSNLKMLGYLNDEENRDMLWVMGLLKKMTLSVSENEGNASINMTKIGCDIKPKFDKYNQVSFTVNLEGVGTLQESNSGLDMTYTKNLNILEKKFEKKAQTHVQQTIKKVQEEYGTDIFGFGEVIHQKDPIKWKSLKNHWDQTFPNTTITVKANIKINRIGMEGPAVLFKESESKK
jgi:spore germination protein KC